MLVLLLVTPADKALPLALLVRESRRGDAPSLPVNLGPTHNRHVVERISGDKDPPETSREF